MFIVMMVALIFAAFFFLFSYESPYYWSLQIEENQAWTQTEVEVATVTNNYRSYPLELEAWQGTSSYFAQPILPHPTPVILFTLLQLMLWAGFLTAMSYVKSNWIFGGLLVFALHQHLTQTTLLLIPGPWGYALEFGVLLLLLGIPYAYTAGWLRGSLWARFMVLLVLLGTLTRLVFWQKGWQGLHALSANSYISQVLWSGFILFMLALGPVNAIIAIATNRRQREARFSYGLTLTITIIWLLSVLFLLNEFVGLPFLPKGLGFIKPAYLLAFAAILFPFLGQNHFHYTRKALGSQFLYTLLLLVAGIFVLSHGALQGAIGDESGNFGMDRVFASLLFFVGLGQLTYTLANHRDLLIEKVNIFFLLPFAPRARFIFVWALAFAGWILVESWNDWSVTRIFLHGQQVRLADQDLFDGKLDYATNRYGYAGKQVVNSNKAHFNHGSLLLIPRDDAAGYEVQAKDALLALRNIPRFPYAALTEGNLWSLSGRVLRARASLREQYTRSPDPYIAANLSASFMGDTLPDSVIVWGKRALERNPNLSSVFSNLAMVYEKQGLGEVANDFYQASLETPQVSDAAKANAKAWTLQSAYKQTVAFHPALKRDTAEPFQKQFNSLLFALKNKSNVDMLARKAQQMADQNPSVGTYLVHSWLRFKQKKYDEAISRLDFARSQFPEQDHGRTSRLMALAYLDEGLPEMARKYFAESYQQGDILSGLAEAQMDLDLGWADSAQGKLSLLRVTHEALWSPASKELALMLMALNQPVFAGTEYDLGKLSATDWVKAGQYADSNQLYIPALENFRRAIQLDSNLAAPYLEMARIYNRYADKAAIENAEYGLSLFPENIDLRLSLVKAYLLADDLNQAKLQLDTAASESPEYSLMAGELALAQGDTAKARSTWEQLHQAHPLFQPAILKLASLYRSQNDTEAGNQLISQALDLNTENPELWYYYAVFYKAWSQSEDAGNGALRAISLSPSPQRRAAIQREFQEEILLKMKSE
jgi:tetratricopeptide (TPR) repeat protein